MASLMDVSLAGHFTSIYVFLLVFAGVFALLAKTEILGKDKKNLDAIVAVVFALLIITSGPATAFISFVMPWFFILALILIFFIFIGKMFGKTDKDVQWAFSFGTASPTITWIIIFVALILVFGFSSMFGQELLEENEETALPADQQVSESTPEQAALYGEGDVATDDYGSNVLGTIFHPKVMGMIALFLVGLTAILLITKSGFVPFKR